jgi:hypothetical protein
MNQLVQNKFRNATFEKNRRNEPTPAIEQLPEALIAYGRRQNKRGDARHPMHGLSSESH